VRAGLAAALAAWLLLPLPALPARAQFVAPEGSAFRNGATLPLADDGAALALLQKLQAAADRQDADETVALLRALRARRTPDLVPFGARVLVPALERAARLVLEPGREVLAQTVLAAEEEALGLARRERDLPALLDRAVRGVSLPTSRAAALQAARLLFEEGRFADAAALAARAGDQAGVVELAAAAARRLPPPASPPRADLGARGWEAQHAVLVPLGEDAFDADVLVPVPLPCVAPAGPGRLAYADGRQLLLVERASRALATPPVQLLAPLQAASADVLYEPLPRRHVLVREGDRWLLPFNPIPISYRRTESAVRLPRLLALDAGSQPSLAFTAAPPAGRQVSAACGPPAAWGGRVYAQVFRSELETEVTLACFDLADGRLLWETPLVTGQPIGRFAVRFAKTSVYDSDKRPAEVAPVVRDGLVWCCTGFGVLAAVDALTGVPRLAFRYDRLFPQDTGQYEPAWLFETGGWDDEPLRFWNGRVVMAPPDSRFLYMLAQEPGPRGDLILDDPIERLDRQHVVELRPDPLGRPSPALLCTRRSEGRGGLVLLGPDGHVLEASPLLPAEQRLAGRPLALGGRVLLPTAAGLLEASSADLAAPPRELPRLPGVPAAVVAVFALDDGLAALSPVPGRRSSDPGSWLLQWWGEAP